MPNSRSLPLVSRLAVYLVADPAQSRSGDLVADVRASISGGATTVQLRSKMLPDGEFFRLATEFVEICRPAGVLFIVNDRLDVAMAVGADGVHVGVGDLPVEVIRRLGGSNLLIGYSPETDEQARAAAITGADYVGLGSVFPTASKPDAGEAIGLDRLHRRVRLAGLPSVAIGGISDERVPQVIEAGIDGIAVISAILHATDPAEATRRLVQLVRTHDVS